MHFFQLCFVGQICHHAVTPDDVQNILMHGNLGAASCGGPQARRSLDAGPGQRGDVVQPYVIVVPAYRTSPLHYRAIPSVWD